MFRHNDESTDREWLGLPLVSTHVDIQQIFVAARLGVASRSQEPLPAQRCQAAIIGQGSSSGRSA
jgi:hypothetical protein